MSGNTRESRHRQPAPTLPLGYADDVPIVHDPLDPHPEIPTPIELVMSLTLSERKERNKALVALSRSKFEYAMDRYLSGKNVVAICALVSGGDDSYTVANVFRDVTTHHVHANTETGIEATREFVRATAANWDMPLIEHRPKPGQGYFDLVRGNVMARSRKTGELTRSWPGGFPGPAAHAIMYQRLKQRALERIPHDFGISGSRKDRLVFIAGRRRPESKVRATVPYHDGYGTIDWTSPMAVWHKADLRTYRLMNPEIPRNPVARTLGMSGECGCLANASPGEPERWRQAFPDDPFIIKVGEVETEIADREDIPDHRKRWGWGGAYADPDEIEAFARNAVCSSSCGHDPLLDMMDPLFEVDA
ncbi:hypothetical protein D2E76_24020 [Mycobacteroides abscessus]|uniref:Phosphoadenosine phosphosulfate reductase n=1 Tax=Mycobacteroides abscessus TaxID=36809 RepID=A0ABD7HHV1_9MYCO|nr:hypothetical protein [Mycobacteroides abscessus]RIT32112.1 hypothetical protein D2E76_24020 [Mycobacteroides abscessus]